MRDAATPRGGVPISVNPLGCGAGCAVAALALYVMTSLMILVIFGDDVVGSTVARVCASGEALDIIDPYRRGADGYYLVIARLQEGDCVSVHGEGVRSHGWDSDSPLTRVRTEDGLWGWLAIGSRPVRMTHAPHLAFVRAPFRTTLYLLGVAFVAWTITRFVRACFGRT